MAWRLEGTYFESCSCDAICPCTWSALTAKATNERCNALLAFHVDSGDVEGVDVGGLCFGMLLDTPQLMSEGNWRVGAFLDAAGSEEQQGALGRVVSGELGGPPAMLGPLIAEMIGVQVVPITFEESGGTHRVQIGDDVAVEVTEFTALEGGSPVVLDNVFHPAASTLTVAPATKSSVSAMGVSFGAPGNSGFAAPFSWAG